MTLGDLIYRYRMENNMSQRSFAARCGVSNGYISMLEKNMNPATGKPLVPAITQFKAICDAMDMTMDEVMRKVDDDTIISLKNDIDRIYNSGVVSGHSPSQRIVPVQQADQQPADNVSDTQFASVPNNHYYHAVVSAQIPINGGAELPYIPSTSEAKILAKGIDRMPEADRKKLLKMVDLMFDNYSEFFQKGSDENDT